MLTKHVTRTCTPHGCRDEEKGGLRLNPKSEISFIFSGWFILIHSIFPPIPRVSLSKKKDFPSVPRMIFPAATALHRYNTCKLIKRAQNIMNPHIALYFIPYTVNQSQRAATFLYTFIKNFSRFAADDWLNPLSESQ